MAENNEKTKKTEAPEEEKTGRKFRSEHYQITEALGAFDFAASKHDAFSANGCSACGGQRAFDKGS